MKMDKEKIKKDDGRYLIYYTFSTEKNSRGTDEDLNSIKEKKCNCKSTTDEVLDSKRKGGR